jgi:rhodanese-related sulfurtransferase
MFSGLHAVRQALWILLTAAILAAVAYGLRAGLMRPEASQPAGEEDASHGFSAPVITLDTAAEYFNRAAAVFADARSETAYQAGHIEGALHLDPNRFDAWSERVFSEVDPDAVIITYCDGEHCTLGQQLAKRLTWLGYDKVYYLQNGWSRWTDSGLPVGQGGP